MTTTISFGCRRPRPTRFSNSTCCWPDSDVQPILELPDARLSWRDFMIIFDIAGCTASTEEQEYFLPLALEYLRANPDDGYEYLHHVVYFISTFASELDRDGLLAPALDGIRTCFQTWTEQFRVFHYDLAACRAKGWRLDHSDVVANSDQVIDLVNTLLTCATHHQVAEELVTLLGAPTRSDTDAAWLLEYARSERKRYAYYSQPQKSGPFQDIVPSRSNPVLYGIVQNDSLLRACAAQIKDTVIAHESSPTYWPDVMASLGLAGV